MTISLLEKLEKLWVKEKMLVYGIFLLSERDENTVGKGAISPFPTVFSKDF